MRRISIKKAISTYWDDNAESYGKNSALILNNKPISERWIQTILDALNHSSLEQVHMLDVGTGTGFFPILLKDTGIHMTCIDVSETMLNIARTNLHNHGVRATLLRMDTHQLKFQDDTFDVIISRDCTWNFLHPERVYREWLRVLKPGGIIINFDGQHIVDQAYRDALSKPHFPVSVWSDCNGSSFDETVRNALPLQYSSRPDYDIEILKSLGVTHIDVIHDISDQLWTESLQQKYKNRKEFMLIAKKI